VKPTEKQISVQKGTPLSPRENPHPSKESEGAMQMEEKKNHAIFQNQDNRGA